MGVSVDLSTGGWRADFVVETRIHLGGTSNPDRGQYDVAPDGRFLINAVLGEASMPPIVIVQHWVPR